MSDLLALLGSTTQVLPVSGTRLRLGERAWPIDAETRSRVDAHWTAAVAANPGLWNGPVVGAVAPGRPGGLEIVDGVLHGEVLRGDFKTLLAWCDWGLPEIGMRNLFGSALVVSADGALIYGRMARSTAWAGWVYPPGGGIELADVGTDGVVDLARSIENELREETGLEIAEGRREGLVVAFSEGRVSVGQIVRHPLPADALAERIRAFLAAQDRPELDDVVVVRRPEDLDASPRVMPFARAFAERLCCSAGHDLGRAFQSASDTLQD